jgi:hypothetical protein
MALVTTVATTPLTTVLYPPWYQKKLDSWKRGEIDWEGNRLFSELNNQHEALEKLQSKSIRRLLVHLRLDSLPSLFTFVALLGGEEKINKPVVQVHGIRMLELTERTSSVMKSSEADEYTVRDPVVNAFRTFAQLNHVAVSGDVSVVPESSYAETIISKASDMSSDLVLIPWSETGTISEGDQSNFLPEIHSTDRFAIGSQMSFVRTVLDAARCNTVVFINRGFGPVPAHAHDPRSLQRTVSGLSIHHEVTVSPAADLQRHVFFPYFGGADDRVALRLVLQLAHSTNVIATIVQVKTLDFSNGTASEDTSFLYSLRDSLPAELVKRVSFIENSTASSIATWFETTGEPRNPMVGKIGDLIIVGRRKGSRHVVTDHLASTSSGAELRRTLGPTAECIISGGARVSLLVVQAAVPSASGPSH